MTSNLTCVQVHSSAKSPGYRVAWDTIALAGVRLDRCVENMEVVWPDCVVFFKCTANLCIRL